MLDRLQLVRGLILVQLPATTEEIVRTQDNGFDYAVTDDAIRLAPTTGKFGMADVYFGKHLWQNAKACAWGDEDERDKNLYTEHNVYAIKENGVYYMLIPKSELFLLHHKIEGELFPQNNWNLCEPVEHLPANTSLIFDNGKTEDYELNFAKIVRTAKQEWFKEGDIIQTLRHCDLPLEELMNNPTLDKKYFIIESDNIISKLNYMQKYEAGKGRLIVKPIEDETEQDSGLINTDLENGKLRLATVMSSAYKNTPERLEAFKEYNEGDTVVIARNSGMALPPVGDQIGYIVINEIDVFAKLKP